MASAESMKELCKMAEKGKITPKEFYDKLSEAAKEDSDLGCLAEDAMMDLEMDGSTETARECAKMILEEINGHF